MSIAFIRLSYGKIVLWLVSLTGKKEFLNASFIH